MSERRNCCHVVGGCPIPLLFEMMLPLTRALGAAGDTHSGAASIGIMPAKPKRWWGSDSSHRNFWAGAHAGNKDKAERNPEARVIRGGHMASTPRSCLQGRLPLPPVNNGDTNGHLLRSCAAVAAAACAAHAPCCCVTLVGRHFAPHSAAVV